MEKINLKDFLDYKFLSGLVSSPSKTAATFISKNANVENNNYENKRYIIKNNSVKEIRTSSKETCCCFDNDNTLIFGVSKEDALGATSFFKINTETNQITVAFDMPITANSIDKISDGKYFITAWIDELNPDSYLLEGKDRTCEAERIKEESAFQVIDEIPYWTNSDGYTNKRRHAGFVYSEKENTLTRITESNFDLLAKAVKNEKVYLVGETRIGKQKDKHQVYCYDIETKATTTLYGGNDYCIRDILLTDTRIILIASDEKPYGFNQNPSFYEVDEKNGIKLINAPDLSVYPSVGSDCRLGSTHLATTFGDELFFIANLENKVQIFKITADNKCENVYCPNGTVDDLCVVDGKLIVVAMLGSALQEVYSLENNKATALTTFNTEVLSNKYVAEPEHYTIELEGKTIHGWVLKPINYEENKTYPAVLDIHGGPKMAYGEVFMHEMQVWANLGYFVFFCNPIGSDGFGDEYTDMRGKYGDIDYRSIMKFTDFVLEKYTQIDKTKVAVTGGSYGGFMTNWIIGHTDRFCCAASQRSISNWITHTLISDLGPSFSTDQVATNVFEGSDEMFKKSPLAYAKNATTPTLFVHAANDHRCPLVEGMQMYAALQLKGVESRMCIIYGETHELSRNGRPKQRIRRLEEITNWIVNHTK